MSGPGTFVSCADLIERAVLLCKSDLIGIEHLPLNLSNHPSSYAIGDRVALEVIENLHIRRVVASTNSVATAASILGIHSGTILRRLRRGGPDAVHPRDESIGPSRGPSPDSRQG